MTTQPDNPVVVVSTTVGAGVPSPDTLAQTTTLDLIARVRDLIAEADADYYSDAEILGYLNEGKSRMFAHLDVLPRLFKMPLVSGESFYPLSEPVARWDMLAVDGRLVTPIMSHEYAEMMTSPSQGTPRFFCPEVMDRNGQQMLAFYPVPNNNMVASGQYYAEPPDLSLGDAIAVPPIPASNPIWHKPYHILPCYYAAGVLLQKDRLHEKAQLNDQKFMGGVAEYRAWFERKFPRRESPRRQARGSRRGLPRPGIGTEPFSMGGY